MEVLGCFPPSPLPIQFSARVRSSAWSPFKEVAINGWEPLQGDRGGAPSHNLWGNCNRSWFLRGLPALIDEVQVAMHPGHLVGREGVGAVIIWNENRSHINHTGDKGRELQPGEWQLLARAGMGSPSTQELMACEQMSADITCGGRWKETS